MLRRGAVGNGHASTLRFAFALNPRMDHSITGLGTLARDPEHLRITCSAMGLPDTEIAKVAYTRSGRARADDIVWNGIRVRLGDLQFRRSKICVACYLENGFASDEWDHVASVACAKHRVLLDDACPCCSTPWTPISDPLACGCPPTEMISRQQRCDPEVASFLKCIIDRGDQAGLLVLGELHATLQSWTKLGMHLSRAFVANALWNMSSGRWPSISDPGLIAPGVNIHPRVALAPLLTAPSQACVNAAQQLLRLPPPHLTGPAINDIRWPASATMKVLGIGRVPFEKIVSAGHIVPSEDGRYSAAVVNDLLWRMQGNTDDTRAMLPLEVLRGGRYRESLARLMTKITSGDIAGYYCHAQHGLSGLHCAVKGRPPRAPAKEISIHVAAELLKTNSESVRSAIELKLLPASKGSSASAVQWTIQAEALAAFQSKYAFASEIAKRHGAPVTTIASRLRSAGLVPISGPNVDGGITFVFRRDDLSRLNIETVLVGSYRSPAGRKKISAIATPTTATLCPSGTAAHELGLSIRQLREVVRQGWISPVISASRRQMYSPEKLIDLRHRIAKDFVSLEEATKQLGQSAAQFRRTWITTQVIRAYRFADRQLVERTDLNLAQDIWDECGSASSIGAELNRQRWLCPNLTKMGALTSAATLGSGSQHVRLYARSTSALQRYFLQSHQDHS